MKQTVLIDGNGYQVEQAVAVVMEGMEIEIETLRDAVVRLAVFVGGDPCWCHCEGGEHSDACRYTKELPLWRSPSGINPPWKDPEASQI